MNPLGLPDDAVTKALEGLMASRLPDFLPEQRWFGSKGRRIHSVSLLDSGSLEGSLGLWLTLVEVRFDTGPREIYAVPLGARADEREGFRPVGRLDLDAARRVVYDALEESGFCLALLSAFEEDRTVPTRHGTIRFARTAAFPVLPPQGARSARRITAEQSNTSVIYDNVLILKTFRKVEAGINPDGEITGFLTTRTRFKNIPLLAGSVEYRSSEGRHSTLAILQHFVPNRGDGWKYALEHLRKFYEFAAARSDLAPEEPRISQLVREFSAGAFVALRRLGALTGGLHAALASDSSDPAFAPELASGADADRWTSEIAREVQPTLEAMQARLGALPETTRSEAQAVVGREAALRERVRAVAALPREGCHKIRIHGDYHLGQTLRTEDDFIIFDFEGEPARPLQERRAKHCPLKDVAGMLRSFDYAAGAALRDRQAPPHQAVRLEAWGDLWTQIATEVFLEGYLAEVARAPAKLMPASRSVFDEVLPVYELDKALYELRYEINSRPAWLPIPLRGLIRILARGTNSSAPRPTG